MYWFEMFSARNNSERARGWGGGSKVRQSINETESQKLSREAGLDNDRKLIVPLFSVETEIVGIK